MADSGITMSRDPIDVITKFEDALTKPTAAAFLFAGERQKSRILDRTQRGLDVDGNAFAPYKATGPYYWYPAQGLKSRTGARNRRFAGVQRVANEAYAKGDWKKGGVGDSAGSAKKTGVGIKFASYGAAKAGITGDNTVNLSGLRGAPHMLQGLVVKTSNGMLTIGIYGDEAKRASAHNAGTAQLPRRHFLGASAADRTLMAQDLMDATMQMLKAKSGGTP
ncbi:MAG TPA: hypothetical protein VNH18_17585 [Bryobacteraceae bacterium]|nr:hypothetical protein [Bryobacteraceae bacterium]